MTERATLLGEYVAGLGVEIPDITARFYRTLFSRHPDVKPLFSRNEPEAQQKMLADAIATSVLNADDIGAIAGELQGLGEQHRDYGEIAPAHYEAVVSCLLETLQELAPEAWSDAIENAWKSLMAEVVQHMQAGHFEA